MQGTMDIMAMIQKSSMVKQKPKTMSFENSLTKSSFKSELAQARINTEAKSTVSQTTDTAKQATSENDNRTEKLAKVMSNSNAVKEKVQDASAEKVDQAKETVKTQEADQVKTDTKVEEPVESVKLESDAELSELVASTEELLQLLMQLIGGTSTGEAAQVNVKQMEETIEAISQKLEQISTKSAEAKLESTDLILKELKVEVKELLKQLKFQTNDVKAMATDKPSLQQTVNTIKHLINKMNEIKPELQQKVAEEASSPEHAVQRQELHVKENKEINKTNEAAIEIKPTEENVVLKPIEESNQNSPSKDKEEEKDSKYKAEAKEVPKHTAATVDKPKAEGLRADLAPQNQKADFQLNLKEINLNHKKEQMIIINKSDIVNQVVKKADIIVREGHSEMIMKLEPESLGKLNLKIVVEKGLITAKFIAESQQVKEVLESSFNQLKDALQEKGISVQNFSVSVGQQSKDPNSNQSFNQWKQSIKIKNKSIGEFMELDDEQIMNQNPYNYHEGKIDYRA